MTKLPAILLLACAVLLGTARAFAPTRAGPRRAPAPLRMTVLTANGKKMDFRAGSPLKNAVGRLGVKPRYSCRKGDCGSCTVSVGGSRIKACVGKVPPMPKLKSLAERGLPVN